MRPFEIEEPRTDMRASSGVARLKRKKRLMRKVKGFRGGRSKLWIVRINAACRSRGINYSQFVRGLKAADVGLNRKMLADLAVRDAGAFDELVVTAKKAIEAA